MTYSVLEQFQRSQREFETLLLEMRQDLERYAQDPNASDKAIAKRNHMLAILYGHSDIATRTVAFLHARAASIEKEAFQRGMLHQKEMDNPDSVASIRKQDPETARISNLFRAMETWPDLY